MPDRRVPAPSALPGRRRLLVAGVEDGRDQQPKQRDSEE
jgi:hypothetical protein